MDQYLSRITVINYKYYGPESAKNNIINYKYYGPVSVTNNNYKVIYWTQVIDQYVTRISVICKLKSLWTSS